MIDDLIGTARRLAQGEAPEPTQADLRRAVSTAYYALFHAIARSGADVLAGSDVEGSKGAWQQTYRALDHGTARRAVQRLRGLGFPSALVTVGDAFTLLQEQRHAADYDPVPRVSRADALEAIAVAEAAIASLRGAPSRDRAAFALLLLLRSR